MLKEINILNHMRKLFEFIIIIAFIFISNSASTQTIDSLNAFKQKQKLKYIFSDKHREIIGVGVRAVVKAVYTLPPEEKNSYFLVEVKLINNSDTLFETVTYNCITSSNILYDSKLLKIFKFPCSRNFPIVLRLKPKQEFSVLILLQTDSISSVFLDPIKFGFIVLNPKKLDFFNVQERLREMRDKQENVIWSDPIYFDPTNGEPFEIKTILNDTTYIQQILY
jgi:hypothetical protein